MQILKLAPQEYFKSYFYEINEPREEELDGFVKAAKNYQNALAENAQNGEDALASNALAIFLNELHLNVKIKPKSQGRSELDLALVRDEQIAVIIEAKKSLELDEKNINIKALHQLILYYFRERRLGNSSLNFLIITDFYRFYFFRARDFEELFYEEAIFKKLFENFEDKRGIFAGGYSTAKFYDEAENILKNEKFKDKKIPCICLDFKDLFSALNKSNKKELKIFFRIFHPDLLLDEFELEANALSNKFYDELLHILGLGQGEGGVLERSGVRGSLYEAILAKYPQELKAKEESEEDEKDKIMALLILWLNRILFLKLIEANLLRFNPEVKEDLSFLNDKKIKTFKDLDTLFFEIFARDFSQRNLAQQTLAYLPYLNSSLFEKNEQIEKITIGSLDEWSLKIFERTKLKDKNGRKKVGEEKLLFYLLDFLNSYDFGQLASRGEDEDAGEKELINSSVLGSVFERLNGYKDGSFYTPSKITKKICEQLIRQSVLDKFNLHFNKNFQDFSGLKNFLKEKDREKKIELLNSIKIIDPAVGSGYFLVSALNAMLKIYDELDCLAGPFHVELKNEEPQIIFRGRIINYTRPINEQDDFHIFQKELFHTKAQIIENNLFGLDLNPSSCELAKLRLWIELLKSSYYLNFSRDPDSNLHKMQTLPNVDIKIQSGNALISYFDTEAQLKNKKSDIKKQVFDYQKSVSQFFLSDKKMERQKIAEKISILKNLFKEELSHNKGNKDVNPKQLEMAAQDYLLNYGLYLIDTDPLLKKYIEVMGFLRIPPSQIKDRQKAKSDFIALQKLHREIYDFEKFSPFEWRFEFPEVLGEAGAFEGFDLVLGNPPYIRHERIGHYKPHLASYRVFASTADIYTYFFERGLELLRPGGLLGFITSNKYTRAAYGQNLRAFLKKQTILSYEDLNGQRIFASATVDTAIITLRKAPPPRDHLISYTSPAQGVSFALPQRELSQEGFIFIDEAGRELLRQVERAGVALGHWAGLRINYGIKTGLNKAFIIDTARRNLILAECANGAEREATEALIRPVLRGRDIKRYGFEWAGLWVIGTFPARKIDIENYPALKAYLATFLPSINQSGQRGCRKKTHNAWFETSDSIAYYEDFAGEKIIFSEIVRAPQFQLDDSGIFIEATGFILTGGNLKYLLGFLNSPFVAYIFKSFYAGGNLGAQGYRYKRAFLERLPIPPITRKNQKEADELTEAVTELLILKKSAQPDLTKESELESRINRLVLALYRIDERGL